MADLTSASWRGAAAWAGRLLLEEAEEMAEEDGGAEGEGEAEGGRSVGLVIGQAAALFLVVCLAYLLPYWLTRFSLHDWYKSLVQCFTGALLVGYAIINMQVGCLHALADWLI